MFKVNSSHQNDATGVFIVNFEHVLLLFLVFLLLTSNMLLSAGMIAYFVANFFPSEHSQNMSGNNYPQNIFWQLFVSIIRKIIEGHE